MITIKGATIHNADCIEAMQIYAALGMQFDACVTDPPYHLTSVVKRFGAANAAPAQYGTDGLYARQSRGFMGKVWDGGDISYRPDTWRAVYDVLKPGAHLVSFGGTKSFHRIACAIEDAGFELRETAMWCFATGFPKSHDVSKAIDKHLGAQRGKAPPRSVINRMHHIDPRPYHSESDHQTDDDDEPVTDEAARWQGWGSPLKPAYEPITIARKPLIGTIAENVLAYGTGAINIDDCRVGAEERTYKGAGASHIKLNNHATGDTGIGYADGHSREREYTVTGRWPANVMHDGSDEVTSLFPHTASRTHRNGDKGRRGKGFTLPGGEKGDPVPNGPTYGDEGSAARFFYSAKASKADRAGSKHPTVKPVNLIRYLMRLVTPANGTIIDPFAGSGTAGVAAHAEGFNSVLIEQSEEYYADICRRMNEI